MRIKLGYLLVAVIISLIFVTSSTGIVSAFDLKTLGLPTSVLNTSSLNNTTSASGFQPSQIEIDQTRSLDNTTSASGFSKGPTIPGIPDPDNLSRLRNINDNFISTEYRPLDLERYVRETWGRRAKLTSTGNHLYDWKVRVDNELKSLNLRHAVHQQYGRGWHLVAVGVHKNDWKAVHFNELYPVVLPVMLVSSDKFFDVDGVRGALARFKSVLSRIKDWYYLNTGGITFRLMQPLVIPTGFTSNDWNNISNRSIGDGPQRLELLHTAIAEYLNNLPFPRSNLRIIIAPYTDGGIDAFDGAAYDDGIAVVAPRATSLNCPSSGPLDWRCRNATYAVGHELGHAFGLEHSCDTYPEISDCSRSIMQNNEPPYAILHPPEINTLFHSEFFFGMIAQP